VTRPVLMVDVDGVVSLFGFPAGKPPDGQLTSVDGHLHLISATAGPLLRELSDAFELVWCTGWEDRANDHLPYLLGLPGPLPHLSFARNPGRAHGHWKLDAIEAYAGPLRPLAWIDDAFDEECHRWARLRARHTPTLLVPTDPAVGITTQHVAELRRSFG
jgi:hypothetical protein